VNVSPPPPALRNVVPPGYRLRLPGPAAVPERVRAALALPVLNHRGPEFHAVLAEAAAGLRRIFGTRRDVFLFGASGTGAMEAALANVVDQGDDVLVVVAGQFGERFAAIADGMGARRSCGDWLGRSALSRRRRREGAVA
jgi:aspartate aminotransferase-like enzyme